MSRSSGPMGGIMPGNDISLEELEAMLEEVRNGYRSVRNAARMIGWTTDEVQMQAFGEIRQ